MYWIPGIVHENFSMDDISLKLIEASHGASPKVKYVYDASFDIFIGYSSSESCEERLL